MFVFVLCCYSEGVRNYDGVTSIGSAVAGMLLWVTSKATGLWGLLYGCLDSGVARIIDLILNTSYQGGNYPYKVVYYEV